MTIPDDELLIECPSTPRPGGQQVTCTRADVKVTHIPTGFAIIVASERSQMKNKAKAILYLEMILELEGCLNLQAH